ncbi:MAG: sugar kinase [Phycisphaerae bacterium]|nr:sugar kinase [Phycisphaerae bacterium]
MSLLVTGSLGIDNIISPHGEAENVLGGTAVNFALAAAFYGPVRLVGVVGGDFPPAFRRVLEERRIDLSGLEVREQSRTFRWTGKYTGDMNEAETVDVHLNVLAEAAPKVPAPFVDSDYAFLAATHPTSQRELLGQLTGPRLVVCDTMNLWIKTERDSLIETLRRVHGVILNDGEARMLTEKMNLLLAADTILELGPRFVIIKKGEHGALLVTREQAVGLPAYPARVVRDPTGAGDSFAGGFMGYLAHAGMENLGSLKRAIVRGTVASSFQIEDFSTRRTERLKREEIDARVDEYVRMLRID